MNKDIQNIGVNDHKIDLFEGQYKVEHGMAYNSYLINDEKLTVLNTVDSDFAEEWLENIKIACAGRTPDYLILQHMEPDHSGGLDRFMQAYPDCKIVGTVMIFNMIEAFFHPVSNDQKVVIKEGDILNTGKHELTFIAAPMVHWPEVMMVYDMSTGSFFSADAFGKFGALDHEEPWTDEARRYYIGIVGKYGVNVMNLFKKIEGLNISAIYPLHGPVLEDHLEQYVGLYKTWASYEPEEKGVVIAYAGTYGHTKAAAEELAQVLKQDGVEHVRVFDLARSDMAEVTAEAFRFSALVLCSITYNGDVFPYMKQFLDHLCERNYQKRSVSFIENGTWAPVAAKVMQAHLSNMKNLNVIGPVITIRSSMNDTNRKQIAELSKNLKATLQ